MRSKHGTVKYLVSFMGEPTTIAGMAEGALVKLKRAIASGNKGAIRKATGRLAATMSAIAVSSAMTSVVKSLIYAMRDDDEDETYLEKYAEALGGAFRDDLNLLNYYPIARDIASIFEGRSIERPDMSLIEDLIDSYLKLRDSLGDEDATNEDKWSDGFKLAGAITNIFGIPAKNIWRDLKGLANTLSGIGNGYDSVVGKNFVEGWTGEEDKRGDDLYSAIVNGDTKRVEYYKSTYKDSGSYDSAVRKALRENDPRIKEAAEALSDGDFSEYEDILNEIVDEGNFDFKNVKAAILKEYEDMTPDEETITEDKVEKEESAFETEWVQMAISMGDTATAKTMREEIINAHIANGKSREEAEASFNSSFGNSVKRLYEDGDISDSEAKSMLVNFGGKTKEEAESKVQYWSFKKQYPDYDLTESAVSKYYSDVKPSGISVEVYYDYTQKRSKAQGVDLNGDGKADSGSVKREVMQIINSLPISSYQKDALYYLNGWSQSTLWEAPWH
jgi:hypothetical protein